MKYASNNQKYGNFYFWRTYSGSEIDLIEERDGVLHGYDLSFGFVSWREEGAPLKIAKPKGI